MNVTLKIRETLIFLGIESRLGNGQGEPGDSHFKELKEMRPGPGESEGKRESQGDEQNDVFDARCSAIVVK